jgi:hypothetical protein
MSIDDLKVDARDLRLIGYMTLGRDIENMLELCVNKIECGELQNDREQLLAFLKE